MGFDSLNRSRPSTLVSLVAPIYFLLVQASIFPLDVCVEADIVEIGFLNEVEVLSGQDIAAKLHECSGKDAGVFEDSIGRWDAPAERNIIIDSDKSFQILSILGFILFVADCFQQNPPTVLPKVHAGSVRMDIEWKILNDAEKRGQN